METSASWRPMVNSDNTATAMANSVASAITSRAARIPYRRVAGMRCAVAIDHARLPSSRSSTGRLANTKPSEVRHISPAESGVHGVEYDQDEGPAPMPSVWCVPWAAVFESAERQGEMPEPPPGNMANSPPIIGSM